MEVGGIWFRKPVFNKDMKMKDINVFAGIKLSSIPKINTVSIGILRFAIYA